MSSARTGAARTLGERGLLWLSPVLVFLVVLAVYWSSPAAQTGSDTIYSIPLAVSLVLERDFDLDEYASVIPADEWRVTRVDGHIYSYFPLGAPTVAAPFVAAYTLINPQAHDQLDRLYFPLEWHIASVITALTAVVIYLIARRSLNTPLSLLVAFIFAFCTFAWSTASRALWQPAPSMLALSLALYVVLLARERPQLIQLAGLPLVFSFVSRPTNSISIVVLTLYVFVRYRRYFIQFALWAALFAAPWFALNWFTLHAFLPPYYSPQRIGSMAQFWEALLGNLASPSRGLFVFSPILLLSFYGIYLKTIKSRGQAPGILLDVLLAGALILHLAVVSTFPHWWGGYSFGSRFMTDMVPYLVYFLIPVMALAMRPGPSARTVLALCTLLAIVSFLIHFRGATRTAPWDWNSLPVSVDQQPARIWDWYDAQFLRTIPALDCLIPPLVAADASSITLRSPQAGGAAQRIIDLYDKRYRNVYWAAQPPPGVEVALSSPLDANQTSLTLIASSEVFTTGTRDLGDLVVTATRSQALCTRSDRLTLRVSLDVPRHVNFLPLVQK